jgi:hypothetical protein
MKRAAAAGDGECDNCGNKKQRRVNKNGEVYIADNLSLHLSGHLANWWSSEDAVKTIIKYESQKIKLQDSLQGFLDLSPDMRNNEIIAKHIKSKKDSILARSEGIELLKETFKEDYAIKELYDEEGKFRDDKIDPSIKEPPV